MHPNPAFRSASDRDNLAFARDRAFGVLSVNADPAPLISHIPYRLSDDGGTLTLHLVRSNPIVRIVSEPKQAVLAVSGADSYVSPDWYEMPDQVPTWNYVAVHLRGNLEVRPQEEMRAVLDHLTEFFEARLAPKPPWRADKMPGELIDRLMRMVVPFRMQVQSVDGTWKLAQNKPDAARIAASGHVARHGFGLEAQVIAALMADPPSS